MEHLSQRDRLLRRQSFIRLVAFLSAILFLLTLVVWVENMLVSSLVAFVLAYLIGPLISRAERKGVDRVWATTTVFVLIGAVLGLAGYLLTPLLSMQLAELQALAPKYVSGLSEVVTNLEARVSRMTGALMSFDLDQRIQSQLTPMTENFFAALPGVLKKTLTVMLLGPFVAFFILKDGRQFSRTLLAMVPNNIFEVTYNIYHQINEQMGQFIRARLMESAIVGAITWVGLVLIDFPFAAFLAVFAAVTNLIPYIGPVIGTIPAVAIGLVKGLPGTDMALLLLVYFVAQLIDAAFIIPVVVAKIVDLHPLTVIVVIIIGAQVMGVVGMLISIPVASALKVTLGTIFRHLTDYRR